MKWSALFSTLSNRTFNCVDSDDGADALCYPSASGSRRHSIEIPRVRGHPGFSSSSGVSVFPFSPVPGWGILTFIRFREFHKMLFLAVIVLMVPSVVFSFALDAKADILSLVAPPGNLGCGALEEFLHCGSPCPPTCDTLREQVCCEVACVAGCYCANGFILETRNLPRKCVPLAACPKPGVLMFGRSSLSVLEGSKMVRIPVIRVNGSYSKISVRYQSVEPKTGPYSQIQGLLEFPDGVEMQEIEIPLLDDDIRGPDVSVRLMLVQPSKKTDIVGESCVLDILDDDMIPGYLELEKSMLSVPENVGSVRLNVLRLDGTDGQIRVKYQTVPDSAVSGSDFSTAVGELVFEEGEKAKTLTVDIVDDEIRESPERFKIELFDPTAGPGVLNFRRRFGSILSAEITIVDNDMRPGTLEMERPTYSVLENAGKIEVGVVRVGGTDGQIRVRYQTVPKSAKEDLDFQPAFGELVFEEGERLKTITLMLLDDKVREPPQSFEVLLSDPTGGAGVINFRGLGSGQRTLITINDDDMTPGTLELERSSYVISEGGGSVQVGVVRVGGSDGRIKVKYQTVPRTALVQTDFMPETGELLFEEGEIRKTISVKILDDNVREPSKTFEVQLLGPTAEMGVLNFRGLGSLSTAVVTITDNDMTPGSLQLEEPSYTVLENIGMVRVPVVRVGGSDGTIRVQCRVLPRSALVGKDFILQTTELMFKEGETIKSIEIQILDNSVKEPLKSFVIELVDPTADVGVLNFRGLGSRPSTEVFITDDDMTPGTLEIERSSYLISERDGSVQVGVVRLGGSDGRIKVKYQTIPKTAVVQVDFVPASGELFFDVGETRQTITVQILNDNVREPSKTFEVQLLDPNAEERVLNFKGLGPVQTAVITITDGDMTPGSLEVEKSSYVISEGGGAVQVGVVRVGGSDGRIKVRYQTVPITALVQTDFVPAKGELVFDEGEIRKTITVQILNDNVREPSKMFEVQLFDPTAGLGVINFRGFGSISKTVVTITDDDMTPGSLELERASYVVSEGGGSVQVGVVRVGGSDGQIKVRYQTVPRTALVQTDFVSVTGVLVFDEGENRKTITVQILNDNVREPSKVFEVQLLDPTAGQGVINFRGFGSISKAVVTITDDDMTPGSLELERASYVVSEGGGSVQVRVVRMGGNDGQIKVRYQTVPRTALVQTDFVPASGELVFNEGETRKTITVQILNDNAREPTKVFEVQLLDPTAGQGVINFRGFGSISKTVVTITDDDMTPGSLELERSSYVISEGGGSVQVGVVRVGGSDGQIKVRYQTMPRTALVQTDFVPVTGELVFNEGEIRKTITVQILNDKVREPSKVFEVQLLDPTAGQGVINFRGFGSISKAVVTITDDDMTPGTLEIEESFYSVQENIGLVRVAVVRVGGSDGTIRVQYRALPMSALPGKDFLLQSGELVFQEGETKKFIEVQILDDSVREPFKTFAIELIEPTADRGVINFRGLGSRPTVEVLIKDDDMTPGSLQLERASYMISEGGGSVQVGVVRLGGSDGQIKVRYQTVPRTALVPTDFVPASGMLVFEEGETRKTITVQILNDNVREPSKVFEVQLLDPTAGQGVINFRGFGSISKSVVTITDDDMTPGILQLEETTYFVQESEGTVQMGVVRVGGSDGQIRVKYQTRPKTAQAGFDFLPLTGELVFGEGDKRKVISVVIKDDQVKEPTESFEVELLDPSAGQGVLNFRGLGQNQRAEVFITDDDMVPGVVELEQTQFVVTEGVGKMQVGVVRLGGSDGQIRVKYQTKPKTALPGFDFMPVKGELVFEDGETRKTIVLEIKDDQLREPQKSFELELFEPSAGQGVVNFRRHEQKQTALVIINDDDMNPGVLQLEQSSYMCVEGVGVLQIAVVRVGGSDGQIRCRYRTTAKTARAGFDFVSVSGEVVFEDGQTRKTIPLRILDDDVKEPSLNFEIELLEPRLGSGIFKFKGLGSQIKALVTIADDDDKPGLLELEAASYVFSESAGFVEVPVVRRGGSDGQISVWYEAVPRTAIPGSDFVLPKGKLIFQDGETRKNIRFQIIDDRIREHSKSFELELLDPSSGPGVLNFRGLGPRTTALITIADDDISPGILILEKPSYTVREADGRIQIGVSRVDGSQGRVRVQYQTVPLTAIPGSDFVPVSGELVFEDGVTRRVIDIQILNDQRREATEDFEVQIFNPVADGQLINFRGLGSTNLAVVSILDDDNNPGVFEFREVQTSVRESSGMVSITIMRTEGEDGPVTLRLQAQDATAKMGQDYNLRDTFVRFGDGDKEKTVQVDIVDDNIPEGRESFQLGLFDPTSGAQLGRNTVFTVTIVDDDKFVDQLSVSTAPKPLIFLKSTSIVVAKGETSAKIPIRREGYLGPLTIFLETIDVTAVKGTDYRGAKGNVNFKDNEIVLTVGVRLFPNKGSSEPKKFLVKISSPSRGVVVDGKDVATVHINAGSTSEIQENLNFGGSISFTSGRSRTSATGDLQISGISPGVSSSNISPSLPNLPPASLPPSGGMRLPGLSNIPAMPPPNLPVNLPAIPPPNLPAVPPANLPVVPPPRLPPANLPSTGLSNFPGLPSGGSSLQGLPNPTSEGLSPPGPIPLQGCPPGTTFRQCSPTCPQVCNVQPDAGACSKRCITGCFCPDGMIFESLTSHRCILPSQCSGGNRQSVVGGGLLGGGGGGGGGGLLGGGGGGGGGGLLGGLLGGGGGGGGLLGGGGGGGVGAKVGGRVDVSGGGGGGFLGGLLG
ncbi:adhesion G-protein coupled receptor V1 [Caerostris darwini]|uniref:Adhesion G-protein coupled receptor V1 n=1 Tax=Caerostris darwini TaxID=1538125 RepID=A0AAV4PEE4_9ARAC|nr:adhesion G-protein coupled receptor V1 [Caerostris darwini]